MRARRRPGNPGFETLLIGTGVVILVGQSLVALVVEYLPAFAALAIAIGGAAVLMNAALRRLEKRGTAGVGIDEAGPVPVPGVVPSMSRAQVPDGSGVGDDGRLRNLDEWYARNAARLDGHVAWFAPVPVIASRPGPPHPALARWASGGGEWTSPAGSTSRSSHTQARTGIASPMAGVRGQRRYRMRRPDARANTGTEASLAQG
jgi:hypothetical protein